MQRSLVIDIKNNRNQWKEKYAETSLWLQSEDVYIRRKDTGCVKLLAWCYQHDPNGNFKRLKQFDNSQESNYQL